MLSDANIARIASTPCAVPGGYVHTFARAIESEVRAQDAALIRQLVEALEHAETTAAYDARGCADLSKCAPAITAGRARLKEIAP